MGAGRSGSVSTVACCVLRCALHHRGQGHGRHEESDPVWSVQAFLLPAFVYSPDELKRSHAKEPK